MERSVSRFLFSLNIHVTYILLGYPSISFLISDSVHSFIASMSAVRNPLTSRYLSHNQTIAPSQTTLRRQSIAKRPCSSDAECDSSAKRAKIATAEDIRKEKEKRRSDREEEFKVKYTRAFPDWIFYFDIDPVTPELQALRLDLEKRVAHMGSVRANRPMRCSWKLTVTSHLSLCSASRTSSPEISRISSRCKMTTTTKRIKRITQKHIIINLP